MKAGQKIDELRREVRRLAADNTLAAYDHAWLRGFILGVCTGVGTTLALRALWCMVF